MVLKKNKLYAVIVKINRSRFECAACNCVRVQLCAPKKKTCASRNAPCKSMPMQTTVTVPMNYSHVQCIRFAGRDPHAQHIDNDNDSQSEPMPNYMRAIAQFIR